MKAPGVKNLCPSLLLLLLLAAAFPITASAEQFVALDVMYEATAANTTNSEFRVAPAMGVPANWRSPIDYANGTAHVRFEVMSKPSDAPTLLNTCFRNPSSYACMKYSPAYTATGVYNYNDRFPLFWQYAMVDWAMGVNQVMLVIKDQDERMVQGDANFYPYRMRVTITIVSPGGTYVPPDPDMPAAGAGGRGGTGGMSGTGGRSGSGGATAMAGRGGSGGMAAPTAGVGGVAGAPVTVAGSGSEPEPEPAAPDASVSDAATGEPEPDEEEEAPGTGPGQLDPQPVAPEPNKRAPPPGGIEGNCAVTRPGEACGGVGWVVAIAGVWWGLRRRRRLPIESAPR